jgi:hypothetical protein
VIKVFGTLYLVQDVYMGRPAGSETPPVSGLAGLIALA